MRPYTCQGGRRKECARSSSGLRPSSRREQLRLHPPALTGLPRAGRQPPLRICRSHGAGGAAPHALRFPPTRCPLPVPPQHPILTAFQPSAPSSVQPAGILLRYWRKNQLHECVPSYPTELLGSMTMTPPLPICFPSPQGGSFS